MDHTKSAESNASLHTKHKQRKSTKNVRSPLSCGPCRSRKLKCNREDPCQNCTVRKEPHACVYAGVRRTKHASTSAVRSVPVQSMQERIDRLESLVQSLASQGKPDTEPQIQVVNGKLPQNGTKSIDLGSTGDRNLDNIQHGLGLMKVDENHSQYRGNTHWGDVFRELTELKTIWTSAQQDQEDIDLNASFTGVDGPALLCGLVKPIAFEELLATLPPKPALDRLLQRFFEVNGPMTPQFHVLQEQAFMRQYENHMANPDRIKIMWLGLLFAVLTMVMLSYHVIGDEPPEYEGVAESLFELYRLRTAQCLKLGDVTKCAPHTLETLIYYTFAEQATRNDNGTVVWMLFGIINRVTMQMGYHRDPAKYPEISIFQGEMRRRAWYFVLRMDDMISFQAGLPSMMRSVQSDTMEPLNIYDTELYEGMTQLPPTRPITDETPTSYMFGKGTILKVLGDIAHFLGSLDGFSYSKVHELDEELTLAYLGLPPHLRMSALERPEMGSSLYGQIIQLEILYHQGICVLHRKFSAKGRIDPKFGHSRTRCLQSAMRLLSLQGLLFKDAKRPDGTISFAQHWYRLSFTSQDFILAAIILCIDLRHRKLEDAAKGTDSVSADIEEKPILAALSDACQIWNEAKESSAEAWKVHRVFSQMLRMLGLSECHPQLPGLSGPKLTDTYPFLPQGVDSMDLNSDTAFDVNQIDWTLWNSFIEGGSFDDAYVSMTTPTAIPQAFNQEHQRLPFGSD